MGCGKLRVACDDGFEVVSKDEHEVVSLTQWHLKHTHQKDASREEILKMARHP